MDKKALYQLCASIFPFMLCSGMVYSVISLYWAEAGLSRTQIGLLYMVGSAMGVFFAPYLGGLSDRLGRKRVLLLCMISFAFVFIFFSLVRNFSQALPIYALEGASWVAMGATVPALIADISPPEKRGWAMGVYERAWSLGWMAGPPLGGFLSDLIGFRLTFILGATLIFIGAIYFGLKPSISSR